VNKITKLSLHLRRNANPPIAKETARRRKYRDIVHDKNRSIMISRIIPDRIAGIPLIPLQKIAREWPQFSLFSCRNTAFTLQ